MAEMIHDARITPLSDKPQLDDAIFLWSGDSRGYNEGNMLVEKTNTFNNLTVSYIATSMAYGNSYRKVLTEKFTRTPHGPIRYEFTIYDSGTFTSKVILDPVTKGAG